MLRPAHSLVCASGLCGPAPAYFKPNLTLAPAGLRASDDLDVAAPQRLARARGAMTLGLGEISRAQLFGGRNTGAGGGLPGVRTADEIKAAYGRGTTRRRARRGRAAARAPGASRGCAQRGRRRCRHERQLGLAWRPAA